jgi:hypothetical protein
MKKETENEVKLVSMANTQFKFTLLGGPEKITSVLRHFCDLLDIEYGMQEEYEIKDTYYDDDKYYLKEHDLSIRLREIKGKGTFVTFKMEKYNFVETRAAIRDELEYEVNKGDFKDGIPINVITNIEKVFRKLKFENNGKTLKPVINVINKRVQFPIHTQMGKYVFCFDRFYYLKNKYFSEYYSEIEIEASETIKGQDKDLNRLGDALCNVLDYEPGSISKYKRGIEWLQNIRSDYKTVHTLMIDVVDYSERMTDIQKQIVQTMNHYAKEVLKKVKPYDYNKIVTIPTGDGLLFVFEDDPELLITLVFGLQEKVSKLYNATNITNRFEFRAGLHTGPVFKYTDINEDLNYAGSGINYAQRAMSFGGKWHILATEDAQHNIIQKNSQLATIFKKLPKKYKAKHGKFLTLYNVFDGLGHGNPETP